MQTVAQLEADPQARFPGHAAVVAAQVPVVALQAYVVSAALLQLEAGHDSATPGLHLPSTQLSFWVHLLPSSQVSPLVFGVYVHAPVALSHVPAVWH
jgi:hypothetical protein